MIIAQSLAYSTYTLLISDASPHMHALFTPYLDPYPDPALAGDPRMYAHEQEKGDSSYWQLEFKGRKWTAFDVDYERSQIYAFDENERLQSTPPVTPPVPPIIVS